MSGTTAYSCSNLNTANCKFAAPIAGSPTVTSVSLSSSTITFTGSSFPDPTLYTAKAVFKSASAPVATWTATSVVAVFAKGVPAAVATDNAVASVIFTRTSD